MFSTSPLRAELQEVLKLVTYVDSMSSAEPPLETEPEVSSYQEGRDPVPADAGYTDS